VGKGNWRKEREGKEEKQKGEGEEEESGVPSGGCRSCVGGHFKAEFDCTRHSLSSEEFLKARVFQLGKWRTAKAAVPGADYRHVKR
jgi:hypothetical protein